MGLRAARSERALGEALRRDRLVLLRTWKMPAALATERSLRLKDQATLNDQLAQLLSRGVPLIEALEVTAQTVHPRARTPVERIREAVAGGASFAQACERTGLFDRVTIAVYAAAERTGDLAGAAAQLATTARRQLAVSGKAATLMIYPSIVLAVSVIAVLVLLVGVVPMIGSSLKDLNPDEPLPFLTQLCMSVGLFLRSNGLIVLGVVAAIITLLVIGRAIVAKFIKRLMRTIPVMKDVVMAQESARFFAVMAAMTRAGVPLADALGVSVRAISHPVLRRQLDRLRVRLIEGGVLRVLIDDVEALPLSTRRLLIAAERSGDLESAFDALADDLSAEVDTRSARLLSVLEPLLLVVMFTLVGSVLLAMMLPLFSAMSTAL